MINLRYTVPLTLLIVVLVLGILGGAWSARRFLPRDKGSIGLGVLYLLILATVAWCLLLPGRKDSEIRLLKPRFLVALDTSESMMMTPSEDIPTRWDVATKALDRGWTKSVAAQCDVEVFPFSSAVNQTVSLSESSGLEPNGSTTLLRDALKKIADRHAGVNVAGALLLSDGIDTREALQDWSRDERPFPAGNSLRLEPPGEWRGEPDLRIDSVTTARRVTVGWKTECKVKISGQGTGGAPLSVKLYEDSVLKLEKPTQIPDEGGENEVIFELDHPKVGNFTYRIRVPILPGESSAEDNEYVVSVQVTDARNRLLYVEGAPRWDYKFLRRILLAQTNLTPVVFYTGADGTPRSGVPGGSMTADMTPSQLALLKIVIIGDLNASELGEQRAANLEKFVDAGGSLVLLGGLRAWSDAGVFRTGLRKILPVRGANTQPLQADKPFPVRLTDTARSHPAFAGDPELWRIVPPVLSVFSGVTLTPAAEVLVEATTPSGPRPIIVTQRYGQGKVTVVMTDSLWRWQLGPENSKNKPYQRFWTQLIAWLLPEEEELRQDQLDLFADRNQLFQGEEILLRARFGGETPVSVDKMDCQLTLPDGREVPYLMSPQVVTTTSGKAYPGFALPFKAETPGAYAAVAKAKTGERMHTSEPFTWFVKPYSPETMPRPANADVLQAIAKSSGGQFFENLRDLDSALSKLEFGAKEEKRTSFQTLWRNWIMVGLIMMLLTVSWGLRKAKNLP